MFGRNKTDSMVTIISEETVLMGSLKTANAVELFGTIESPVNAVSIESSSRLRVASSAKVRGDIIAVDVIVEGYVVGNIKAIGQVKLVKGSTLMGDLTARSLVIEDGVNFTGSVKVEQSSTSEE